jgi:prepilin-type N-terminal cleavage/methylation domain-containing protein
MTTHPRRGSGFSIIELMLVVSLIGILGVIAISGYRGQIMRTRRVEAVMGLEGIHRSQQTFYGSTGYYGDTFDEIGFSLDGGKRIDSQTIEARVYTFEVTALPLDGKPRGNFQARATGDLDPGDGVLDILIIENVLTIDN